MDLLAVDVGNTRINSGVFRQGILTDTWHSPTASPAEAARSIAEAAQGLPVAISSVVPQPLEAIRQALSASGKTVFEVDTRTQHVLKGVYETLGCDRLADAVAAWRLYGKDKAALAIDLGTATTLTAVSADGEFRGGLITLGLGRTLSSLHSEAAQLPPVLIDGNEPVGPQLAFDTESAILKGALLSQVGTIENWIKIAKKSLGTETATVATGGWSALIAKHTSEFDYVDPHLTLKGIYLLAEAEVDLMGRH